MVSLHSRLTAVYLQVLFLTSFCVNWTCGGPWWGGSVRLAHSWIGACEVISATVSAVDDL